MNRPWECPDCHTANLGRSSSCEVCGYERGRRGASSSSGSEPPDLRCSWTEGERRCWMPGALGVKSPRCTWHSFARSDPRAMSNLEEFERWTAGLLEARYCAAWTHYRVGDLWQAVRGAQSLPLTPVACLAGACPHRPAPAVLADWRGGIAAAFSSASLLAPPRPRVRGVATDQDPLGRTPVPDEPGPQPVSALLPDVPAAVAPEASDG